MNRMNDLPAENQEERPVPAESREESPRQAEAALGAEAEAAPRRRRRMDRYEETSGEEQAPRERKPALNSSETAREVANRYRQRQAQIPVRPAQRAEEAWGAGRQPQDSGERERVGYAPGRMGISPAQRARMSEAGRARLAAENQAREAGSPEEREAGRGGYPGSARYPGRQPIRKNPEAEPRHGRKGLVIAVSALLAIGALMIGLLLVPEDGDGLLSSLRRSLSGLVGGGRQEPRGVLAFELTGAEGREAPAEIVFTVRTERGVADVRLVGPDGEPLPTSRKISGEEEITWELVWRVEEAWEGRVSLQILAGESWNDTEYGAEVLVLPPVPSETQAPELPVVFTTDTSETPEKTAAAEPEEADAFPEDGDGEADAEAEGENEAAYAPPENESGAEDAEPEAAPLIPAGADPDDPGADWDGESETELTEAEPAEDAAWEETPEDAEPEEAAEEPRPEEGAEASEPEETPAEEGGEAPESENADAGQAGAAEAAEAPEKPLMTAKAAESADPSLITATVVYNGTKKVAEYARSDSEKIHMPVLGEYTKQKMGVLTFRSDAFRQNAAVGTVKGLNSLTKAWTAEAGSVKGAGQTYYGIGWVGQPAIVKWSQQVRAQSEMYDAKKEKTGLKEVIAAGLDGRIYFLDLADGTPTRNSIKLGYPMKAAPSVHPGGAPYMTVGQFARKMASGRTGHIGLRQYNLYMLKELSLIDGLDGKNNRPYNQIGSFETSALIDRKKGCMITAGTNGMLYLIDLNAEFDYNAGTYSQSPATVVMKSRAKGEKDADTAVEASVAMYDKYVYYADMGGILRCVDTDTLKPVWALSLGDAVESTPALDWHGGDGLDLYVATLLSTRKKGNAEVLCVDALSGEIRWTAEFGVKKDTKNKTVSGFRASPVVGQNGLSEYVYYTVNNLNEEGQQKLGLDSETAALIALRKADGEVAWARGLSGRAYSSPVAVYTEDGSGAVIQCAGDGSILMLDGETGEEKASLQLDGAIEASPAVYDSMLVIGTSERNQNNIYGIRIE